MIIWENIIFAFSALFANKVRSLLTMLGIVIGVFAVSTLISIGEGLRSEFSQQIEGLGSNIIVVTPGKIDPKSTTLNPSTSFGVSTLTTDDADEIKEKVENVEKAAPMTLLSGSIVYNNRTPANLLPISTTPEFFTILENDLQAGQYFSDGDMNSKNRVMVLGGGAAQEIFVDLSDKTEDELAREIIGKKLKFLGEDFTIIGVLQTKEDALNFGGSDTNDLILIPRETAREITKENAVFRILIKINDSGNVEEAKQDIKTLVKENHSDAEDFSVLTQEEVLDVFNNYFDILSQAVIGIAAISLIVGGIGIMNIMLVSVTERTREIGLRKAIGASSFQILFQFLVEATVLSVASGVIGVALAVGTGSFISHYLNIPTSMTWQGIILATVISVGTGIIFGIMPASKAARKSPIEALRYE